MDQVEGEAGHPQPLEPGPIQVSHEKPAAIGQTEDEKNRARQIQEPSPQWPGRVRSDHRWGHVQTVRGLASPETPASFCPDVRKTRAKRTPARKSTNLEGANRETK